jgi:nucleotide-binding universal stress UspA family protein
MFRKILYPTDFSDVSLKALDYIKQLKEGGTKEVLILHVVDSRGLQAIETSVPQHSIEFENALMEDAEGELKTLETELKKHGLKVTVRMIVGNPLLEILKAEKEEAISIIVIGSHGKSNLEEMFMGSVSEKVVRKCEKPVLVVKR